MTREEAIAILSVKREEQKAIPYLYEAIEDMKVNAKVDKEFRDIMKKKS
jgi:hypothetical protein